MKKVFFTLLKQLVSIQAVSGEEDQVFSFIEKCLKQNTISYIRLPHGDIVVGKLKRPRLLLTAHVDEVGFQVTSVYADGTCQIKDIGWVYPWLFSGREIQLRSKKGKLHHGLVLYDVAFDKKIHTWKKLRVDVGFNSKAQAVAAGVVPGVFGSYQKFFSKTAHRVFASALDNRLSVALLLTLLIENRNLLDKDICIAFTSDEEMENSGAKKTVPIVDPDFVCVVDIMPHSLFPTARKIDLSGGPYVLDTTKDYALPKAWKDILQGISYLPLRGTSEYLSNSEPKMFQRAGYMNSINFLTIMANYHHGTYSCHTVAIDKSYRALQKVVQLF